jgi:hypothetical protein
MQRLLQTIRSQRQVKAVLERVTWHTAKAFREALRVAEVTPAVTFVHPVTGFYVESVHSI